MVGDSIEGHDVQTVQKRVGEAVALARKGGGPTFLEIKTYRFRGHSMSDPGKYRSRTELEERKKREREAKKAAKEAAKKKDED